MEILLRRFKTGTPATSKTRSTSRVTGTRSPAVGGCSRGKQRNSARSASAWACLTCFTLVTQVVAQTTGDFGWLLQFGTTPNDLAWDVHTSEAGNVHVVGSTRGVFSGQLAMGAQDAFVRRFDAAGNEIWTHQFGTTGDDQAFAVAARGADLYVAGLTGGALSDPGHQGGSDAFLRKYDENGNEQWTRQVGTAGPDEAIGVFVDETGVYICGLVTGGLPGQSHAGMADAFVQKFDTHGSVLWTRQFGTAGRDSAFRMSGDDSGIIVAGSAAGALPSQMFHGGPVDAFVRKYDRDGREIWTRQFGTSGIDLAIGVAVDGSGVYVVGRADRALPGQTQTVPGADAYVRKYDQNGNELWTRQFGTELFDLARGVSVRNSVVYLSGVTGGDSGMFPAASGADVFVRAYTALGTHLWTRRFGSVVAEENWGISAGASGLFVVGSTAGTLPGQASQSGIDAFIGRLVQEIVVELMLRPTSGSNTLNLRSRGTVPLAILSSETFDATTVNPGTVLFEGASLKLDGRALPMASTEDVNGDGLYDLLLHVDVEASGVTSTDVTAELTGLTFAGRVVLGFTSIRIVP